MSLCVKFWRVSLLPPSTGGLLDGCLTRYSSTCCAPRPSRPESCESECLLFFHGCVSLPTDGTPCPRMGPTWHGWDSPPTDGPDFPQIRLTTHGWILLRTDGSYFPRMGLAPPDGSDFHRWRTHCPPMGLPFHGWDSLPTDGSYFPRMGLTSHGWDSLPTDGSYFPRMGLTTHGWVLLPTDVRPDVCRGSGRRC